VIMFAQKFETKILKDGTIKLPASIVFKKNAEVEVIILEMAPGKKIKNSTKKVLTPIDFFNKWVGTLKKNEVDDYWQYVENKSK